METTRTSVNGNLMDVSHNGKYTDVNLMEFKYMDISIARYIKRPSNMDTREAHAGIHDYTSENIKFEFAYYPGCASSNSIPEPKRSHDTPQAGQLVKSVSGSNRLPGTRVILLPFIGRLKPNINNLLRKL